MQGANFSSTLTHPFEIPQKEKCFRNSRKNSGMSRASTLPAPFLIRFRRGRLRTGLLRAAFDTDAIIATIENQNLASHAAPLRIGHFGRRGRGPREPVLAVRARIGQLLADAAPALGADHHVADSRHSLHLAGRTLANRALSSRTLASLSGRSLTDP